jgi:cephalosporin-C deacetylase
MSDLQPYVPEDFDEFWGEAVAEANAAPLDFHRSLTNDFDLPGFIVETVEFRGMKEKLHGWLAYPPQARRAPGFVWVPPYGRESLLPNEYGTREGFVSFSFNFFGHGAFHQEKYVTSRGYFAEGAESPETWVFRRMLQDAILATRVLQAQLEADENRIGAMGMSQGAGISIWLGAWCKIVRAVCADMPFLGAIRQTLLSSVYRYPLKEVTDYMETIPLGKERVLNTISYFDTINQATRCEKPTLVSRGLKDPACRPETVQAVFDALPGTKMLRTYDWGHDWHPDMIENNRQWLLENMRVPG